MTHAPALVPAFFLVGHWGFGVEALRLPSGHFEFVFRSSGIRSNKSSRKIPQD